MTTIPTQAADLSVVTTEHPNAATMRTAFAAFAAGDLEAVRATLADDCTWTAPGDTPVSGRYEGWDAIAGMFMTLFTITGGSHRNELVSVTADATHAVAVYDATSTIAGRTATLRYVLVDEVGADGRATACWNLPLDLAAAEAHLSGR